VIFLFFFSIAVIEGFTLIFFGSVVGFSTGDSMQPNISNFSLIVQKLKMNLKPEEVNQGDVVTYFSDRFNVTVIHRVIGVADYENGTVAAFTVCGDNPDHRVCELVYPDQIKAKLLWNFNIS